MAEQQHKRKKVCEVCLEIYLLSDTTPTKIYETTKGLNNKQSAADMFEIINVILKTVDHTIVCET